MDKKILQIMQDNFPRMFKEQLGDFSAIQPSTETHNGVNSPRIKSTDLLPYPLSQSGTIPNTPTGFTNLTDGTIQFYRYDGVNSDWGMDIALGGIWNPFTIVPSAVRAWQETAQTLTTGTSTAIIFDQTLEDTYPPNTILGTGTVTVTATGFSIVGTGTSFTTVFVVGNQIIINGQINEISVVTDNTHMTVTDAWMSSISGAKFLYLQYEYNEIDGTFTPNTAGAYLITSGVSFTNSGHSGEVTLAITLERGIFVTQHMTKSIYIPSSATTVTIDITGIVNALPDDSWFIVITQSTGANQITLLENNTWLNIQKMK